MKKIAFAGVLCTLLSNPVSAGESIYSDEVVVTANRISQPRDSVIADVSVIEREEIERAGQSTLVELLRTQPGVEIESSGGAGQLANIYLRGTGSQAVVVLVDGMRIGSATTGTTAFNQISPEQIERIEILRGPASSLYGADAIGGVIQIFTRQGDGKPHASAYAGYGSYNTTQAGGSYSNTFGDTRVAFNLSAMDTDGISAYRTHQGQDSDDDSFRNLTASGNVIHTLAAGHEIGVQIYNSDGHSQYDGNDFPDEQDMRQYSYALTSSNRFQPNWLSRLKLGESMDKNDGKDSFGRFTFKTYQHQYSWQNDFTLPLGTLTLAFDRLVEHVMASTDYSKSHRSDNGLFANYLLDQGAHTLHAGLRTDDNSQFGRHNTGNIGYGYRLNPLWRVTGNYGTAFRAPTFNDLYWPLMDFGPYGTYQGNPNLKPETSHNEEIALVYDQGHHRVSATVFRNQIDDLLICCQGLFNDMPTNVGSATIKGLTLTYEGWFGHYHLRTNADVQSPKDDDTGNLLPRRARRHGALVATRTWGDLELGTEMTATSRRYNDTENDIKLGGYALLNLIANYKLDVDWSLNARLNNVFDREYTLATNASSFNPEAPDYNTPGANLFIGLRWQPQ